MPVSLASSVCGMADIPANIGIRHFICCLLYTSYDAFVQEEGVDGYRLNQTMKTYDQISQLGVKVAKGQSLKMCIRDRALQGKTAGVQVLSASAKPGASPQVRIRGISSNGSCDPLYVCLLYTS